MASALVEKKRVAGKVTRGSQTPTPVKKMPKKPAAKPDEPTPSIWRKRKGTQAKARSIKKKKVVAEGDVQPVATRPPVTLLPRLNQEVQPQQKMRRSHPILFHMQVGIGPYEPEGFGPEELKSVKSEAISEAPQKEEESKKKRQIQRVSLWDRRHVQYDELYQAETGPRIHCKHQEDRLRQQQLPLSRCCKCSTSSASAAYSSNS